MSFLDLAGKPCNFATWYSIMTSSNREVSYEEVKIGGDERAESLFIHTRYSGCGGSVYKISIIGKNEEKICEDYIGYLEYIKDLLTSQKECARLKVAIEGTKPDDLNKIPIEDTEKVFVKQLPVSSAQVVASL